MIIVLTRLVLHFSLNLQARQNLNIKMILKISFSRQKTEINSKMWSLSTHVYEHIPIWVMYNTQTYPLSLLAFFSKSEIVFFSQSNFFCSHLVFIAEQMLTFVTQQARRHTHVLIFMFALMYKPTFPLTHILPLTFASLLSATE